MGPGRICILVLCILLYFQDTLQAKAQKCRRTNKKPFRYCLNRQCTSDSDCRANEQCLCDGDCGLSCVQNGTDCGKLDTPKALRVRLSESTKFGSVARFSCKGDQYTLRGSKKRVCRGIGKWDGKDAKCRILCKHPGDIAYGNNNGDKKNYRVGATVRYWCFPGYDMEGQSVTECNNKGKWKTPPPKCEAPSCSKPIPPDNAFIYSRQKLKEKYKYNEVVRFRCEHGHYTSGSSFQRCLANGWSNSDFRCIPKSCGDPGSPVNGKRQGYVFTFKRKVYFKCNRGYKLDGPEYRQCQANQKWSDRTPTCKPINCGRLEEPDDGEKIEETSTLFGGKVVFDCKKIGFEMKGSKQRFCQEDGQWSGTNTTCERVECKDLGTPRKGVRKPDKNKYVYEDKIEFSCNTNYTFIGRHFVICQSDRTWSGAVPRCLAPCRDPGIPIGGHRYQHSFLHNSIVQFSCNSGWTVDGSRTIRCTDGRWDHNSPTCNKACLRPNKYPVNGGIRDSYRSYRHKYRIRYYCNRGYNLVGQEYVRCLNGTWETKQPTCRPVECRDPGKFVNGGRYPDRNKYVFKDSIRFQCKTNYTLRGYSSITCQHDKRWSGNVPKCLAPCKDPGIPNNGQRLDHSFLHNARVRFSCRRGWNIEGSYTITCNDGNWDHTTPECMECGSALGMESKKIPDGNIRASSTRWGYHAKYGRLNGRYAWCSGTAREPYLQIDFGKPYRITALATQGSTYNNRWVENYTVTSNLAGSSFNMYREDGRDKIFIANNDTASIHRNKLRDPVIARRLRIYPQKPGRFSYACIRVEIYGCGLPSDCILIGSRVVAKWDAHVSGGYKYLKAYLTGISKRYWRVELEDENHGRPLYKYLLKYVDLPFVLDVPPKHEELQVGTRVLVPWGHTYFTGTIKTGRDRYNRYRIRADDGDERDFTIDQIRVLKAPAFCN